MHALVFRFFQERVDPAAIAFDPAQRAQMLQRAADHSGHGGDRFQDHRPMAVPPGEEESAKNRSSRVNAYATRSERSFGTTCGASGVVIGMRMLQCGFGGVRQVRFAARSAARRMSSAGKAGCRRAARRSESPSIAPEPP